jgi:hypothetical protein
MTAYLTPVEIVVLVDAGVKPSPGSVATVKRARADIKAGKSNRSWFYFEAP